MILSVDCKQFINLAKTVTKNVGKDVSYQLILNINENKTLNLSYCSSTCILSGDMPFASDSHESKALCLSGAQLKTVASLIYDSAANIDLEISQDGNILIIHSSTSDFRVPIIDTPIVNFSKQTKDYGAVNGFEFIKTITELSRLIPNDAVLNNHAASCLNLIAKDNVLRIVSTNTFGLIEKTIKYDGKDFSILLKPSQVTTLLNTFAPNDVVNLIQSTSSSKKFGFYNSDNVLHLVSTVNLEPLKYDAFKTTAKTEKSFIADVNDFKYGIQAMTKLSPDSNQIWLRVNDDKIEFKNTNGDTTDISLDVPTGDTTTIIQFGAQTLNILSNYINEKIKVYYGTEKGNQVIKIESLKKDKNSEQLIVDENTFIATGVAVMNA